MWTKWLVGGAVGLGLVAVLAAVANPEVQAVDPVAVAALAQDIRIPYRVRRHAMAVAAAASKYAPRKIQLAPEQWARMLLALIDHESNGNERAVGDQGHAFGLGQINDRFWPDFAALPLEQKFDPETNATYAAKILSQAIDYWAPKYGDAIKAGLASYNSGIGNVQKAVAAGKDPDYYTTKTRGVGYGADILARYETTGGDFSSGAVV